MKTAELARKYFLKSAARVTLLRARGSAAAGFTLIELMVVAVVLAILAAAIIPRFIGQTEKARCARAESDIAALETALELFHLNMGHYPSTEEGLRVLYFAPETDEEKWAGPHLTKPRFKDPWDNEYVYRSPGTYSEQPYEIVSYGKDGEEGGEGDDADITSWVDIESVE